MSGKFLQQIPKAFNGKIAVPAVQKQQAEAAELVLQDDHYAEQNLKSMLGVFKKNAVQGLSFDLEGKGHNNALDSYAELFGLDHGVPHGDLTLFALSKGAGKSTFLQHQFLGPFTDPDQPLGMIFTPAALQDMVSMIAPDFKGDGVWHFTNLLRKTLVDTLPSHLILGLVGAYTSVDHLVGGWGHPDVVKAYVDGATHHVNVIPKVVTKQPHKQEMEVELQVVVMRMDQFFANKTGPVKLSFKPGREDSRDSWRVGTELAEAFDALNCTGMCRVAIPASLQGSIFGATGKDASTVAYCFEASITIDQSTIEDWVLTNA